jgi:hypothetical protein
MASRDLDRAVAAVVSSDPKKQRLLDEFFATGRHLLKLASIIRTLGVHVDGVREDDLGLVLRLHDQIRTGYGSTGASAFKPDPDFSMAMIDLRTDADVRLRDLPAREP